MKDAGELRITVGDVTRFSIGQRVNDQPKGGERLVNTLGLLEYLAFGIGLPNLFRASEIHQVELPRLGREVRVVPLCYGHDENGVRPRGLLVHVGYPDGTVVVSDRHQLENLIFISHILFGDISNVDALRFVLMNLKVSLRGVQKVLDLLQVDLHHRELDCEFNILRSVFDFRKDSLNHARDHALHFEVLNVRALHGVRFSRRSLAIRQYGAIEALKN